MFIAEFGSKHNGRPDINSDRDLIIISDDYTELYKQKNNGQSSGYSVTIMSKQKSEYLAKNGSLFIKHIIQESSPIFGNSYIYELSKMWKKGTNYSDEIESNLDLLELLYALPKNPIALNFTNDLIITSIRNILIRKLAIIEDYSFGWADIFRKAIKYGLISNLEINHLLISKQIKNSYRNGIYPLVPTEFIYYLSLILSRLCSQKINFSFSNKKTILSLPDKFKDNTYKQLRAIELVCCFYNFGADTLKFNEIIKQPNYFCSTNILTKN